MIPNTKPSWQEMRRKVAEHAADDDATQYDQRDISKRMRMVEVRLTALEERGFAKFEALAASYGIMAEAQQRQADTLDQLVSRSEFDAVRYLVYWLCAGGVLALMGTVLYLGSRV